jgi:hypothetical protein
VRGGTSHIGLAVTPVSVDVLGICPARAAVMGFELAVHVSASDCRSPLARTRTENLHVISTSPRLTVRYLALIADLR